MCDEIYKHHALTELKTDSDFEEKGMTLNHRSIVRVLFTVSMVAIVGLLIAPIITAQQYDASLYSGLHWRMIGPFRAGRVNAVSGVVGQPDTFYFGSVGGGVWKTTNAGRTWNPVFDSASSAFSST